MSFCARARQRREHGDRDRLPEEPERQLHQPVRVIEDAARSGSGPTNIPFTTCVACGSETPKITGSTSLPAFFTPGKAEIEAGAEPGLESGVRPDLEQQVADDRAAQRSPRKRGDTQVAVQQHAAHR